MFSELQDFDFAQILITFAQICPQIFPCGCGYIPSSCGTAKF